MNTSWLLKSRTVWGALLCSAFLSTAILWLLPGGLPYVLNGLRLLTRGQPQAS